MALRNYGAPMNSLQPMQADGLVGGAVFVRRLEKRGSVDGWV